MNTALLKLYNKIEQQRMDLLAELKNQNPNLLSLKPLQTKWSVLQILTHLYTSEKLSISYIKKKSLGIESLDNAGLKQTLLMPVLKISQRLPFRFKAPRVVVENTPDPMPLDQLINQWNLLRLELRSHLDHLADTHVHKLVYKHPIAGRLSLPQAMQFFAEHITHHKPQIIKVLKVRPLA